MTEPLTGSMQEVVYVVTMLCSERGYFQTLAAFTDRTQAEAFASEQDTEFVLGDIVADPNGAIANHAAGADVDGKLWVGTSAFGSTDLKGVRVLAVEYIIEEIAWNQMLGRMIPRTLTQSENDTYNGPALESLSPSAPKPLATMVTHRQVAAMKHEIERLNEVVEDLEGRAIEAESSLMVERAMQIQPPRRAAPKVTADDMDRIESALKRKALAAFRDLKP